MVSPANYCRGTVCDSTFITQGHVATMKVLSLKQRVIKNLPELGRSLDPKQLFHDVSPVLSDFDREELLLNLDKCIRPILFHKIFVALKWQSNWETYFVEAVRLQNKPDLLQRLGIPEETAQDDGGAHQDQLDPGVRGVAGGQFRENQQHSCQYQQAGHASTPPPAHYDGTPRAAVGHHCGLERGAPVQPLFLYSGQHQLDINNHSENSNEHFGSNAGGRRPDISPHVLQDQTQKMQQLQNSSQRQGVTKRDLVKNVTACLQSTVLATQGGQRGHIAPQLNRPHYPRTSLQELSPERHLADNLAVPCLASASYAQNTRAALNANSSISAAIGSHAMISAPSHDYLGDPVCRDSPYNINESLVDNNAYPWTTHVLDGQGYKTYTFPVDACGSPASNVDKETVMSTGFTATPAEGQPDLKEDSGELFLDSGNSDVYHEQTDVLADTVSVTSTQTDEVDEPRPPLERETSQTHIHFGSIGKLQMVIRESGVTVIGSDNSVNMTLPHVAQTRTLNTGEEERASCQEESGEDEHERSFQETEREPSAVPEEAVSPSPQSPVSRPVEETEHESQVASSLSESVCLSTNPFSIADSPQLMNLKTPDNDILRLEDSMPQTSPGEECPGILSSQTRGSDSGVSNPESLHLAWDDPRHETFVKGAVQSGASDQQGVTPQTTTHSPRQHSHSHVTSQELVNTNTTALTATENVSVDRREGDSLLSETINNSKKETTVQKYINIRETRTGAPTAESDPTQSAQISMADHAQTIAKIKHDQNNPETQTDTAVYSLAASDLIEDAVSGMTPPLGSVSVETFSEAGHSSDYFLESGAISEGVTGNTQLLDVAE